MSEDKTQETSAPVEAKEEVKQEQPKTESKSFTQEQLDNIVQARLMAERKKYERKMEEEDKQKTELLKQKQLEEAKSKAEIEKLMKERIAEKDTEITRYKTEIKKEKIDNSILSVASKNNAINPQQVVQLIEKEVKLNDDGRIEVLDNNSNIRYNAKGELLTIEDRVKEFLDTNPHFRNATVQGSGSKASIGGNTVKPLNIQDLDLNKPEDRKAYAEYRKKRDTGAIKINLNN
ncbi:Phage minor structural protein GP20 [uncultured Mediterranean phage uvMED]|nr:Phage minor structural protein GP20 [uncultured Mediterranean phage uvMED]BAQ91432.1 Phage minor structural protein GP20 [uncultured Mediterranean phage uvMED]BAQ91532.1 Phage minor structural protein GP20 [uncultured Mediterranean phage uvMED]